MLDLELAYALGSRPGAVLHRSWRKASNESVRRKSFAPEFHAKRAILNQGLNLGADFPCERPECKVCFHQVSRLRARPGPANTMKEENFREHKLFRRMLLWRRRSRGVREPEAMGYCHCQSCRSWSASPVNAFTLWKPENVKVTKGADQIGTYQRTEKHHRQFCRTCGGHVMSRLPAFGLIDVFSATIPIFWTGSA